MVKTVEHRGQGLRLITAAELLKSDVAGGGGGGDIFTRGGFGRGGGRGGSDAAAAVRMLCTPDRSAPTFRTLAPPVIRCGCCASPTPCCSGTWRGRC